MTTDPNASPFPIKQDQTAITIAYRNGEYIADDVLPRVQVEAEAFTYNEYPIEQAFTLPDTHVGRRGQPNEISLMSTEKAAKTMDYGLDDPIPQADIDKAPAGQSPIDDANMQLTDFILLDREVRTAGVVFNATNYATGLKVTLSGTSQFSDYTNSDPLGVIMNGLDACLIRPNIMTIGQGVYSKLIRHPDIVQSVKGTGATKGIVTRRELAELFELEDVLVGKSRLNTARKGQEATLSRIWGNHISLTYRNKLARAKSGITFGLTTQYGTRIAGYERDSKIGLKGGQRVRVGEQVKELIIAPQAGYLIIDAA